MNSPSSVLWCLYSILSVCLVISWSQLSLFFQIFLKLNIIHYPQQNTAVFTCYLTTIQPHPTTNRNSSRAKNQLLLIQFLSSFAGLCSHLSRKLSKKIFSVGRKKRHKLYSSLFWIFKWIELSLPSCKMYPCWCNFQFSICRHVGEKVLSLENHHEAPAFPNYQLKQPNCKYYTFILCQQLWS